MNPDLAILVDRWWEGTLDPSGTQALAARVAADPGLRAALLADIAMQGRLGALLDDRDGGQVWLAVEAAIASAHSSTGAQRILDGRERPPGPRPARRRSAARGGPASWARRPALLIAAGMALASALVLWTGAPVAQRRADRAIATLVERTDTRIETGGVAVAEVTALAAGDILRVGPHGRARLRYADGSEVMLEGGAAVHLEAGQQDDGSGGQKRLRLEQGVVTAVVARQPAGLPMRLLTPQAEALVLGTRLRLAVVDGATRLEVIDGVVEMRRGADERVTVQAGESAVAQAGTALAAVATPAAQAAWGHDFEDGGRPADLMHGDVVPGPARAGSRFCVQGQVNPNEHGGAPLKRDIWFERPGAVLFAAPAELEVSFDCWLSGGSRLDIGVWDEARREALWRTEHAVPQGRWIRLTISCDDFRSTDPASRISVGDQIKNLIISAPEGAGALYVDDLEVGAGGARR